jgi:hypothetical protein
MGQALVRVYRQIVWLFHSRIAFVRRDGPSDSARLIPIWMHRNPKDAEAAVEKLDNRRSKAA